MVVVCECLLVYEDFHFGCRAKGFVATLLLRRVRYVAPVVSVLVALSFFEREESVALSQKTHTCVWLESYNHHVVR